MAEFRQRALAALGAAAGMVILPATHWWLVDHGPASRVVYHPYLPPFGFYAVVLAGAAVGASLGAEVFLLFRAKTAAAATPRRTPWWRLAALAMVVAAIVGAQLRPFPCGGTVAERDAWARAHVRQYASLVRIVSRVPEVVSAIGPVTAVAPTARDRHAFGPEMDGDDLHLTLDVVGERGAGVFFADCTIAGDWIVAWRSGSWTSGGKTTPIDPRGL